MIYFIGELDERGKPTGVVKIGYTSSKSAAGRLGSLQCGNARPLKVLKQIKGGGTDELSLHRILGDWRLSGEWFAFSAHAVRVLTWKRVVDPPTFLAALGERYAASWKNRYHHRLDYDPYDAIASSEIALPAADADLLRERVGSDGDMLPARLRLIAHLPDDDGNGAGAGLRVPGAWQRRLLAAARALTEAA